MVGGKEAVARSGQPVAGNGALDDDEWKVTAIAYWGDVVKEDDATMHKMPSYKFDPEFNGLETNSKETCGHWKTPARRVCSDIQDMGRRFLGCPYEDHRACGYVKWLDKDWTERARVVITDLASEKMQLLKKEKDMERKIQKLEFEKKIRNKMHKEELKRRDRKELFVVVMYAMGFRM
ncbi:uncharacterized protein LOC125521223 [Triticum urartu]|uniref:uncharacterized protein LOC125521223 n=1 Tax=Triticum urartu TaxID=4572 RepID=UPI00204370D2|nr:uncharacterized protein LOC125521223 [Triticum urartu]